MNKTSKPGHYEIVVLLEDFDEKATDYQRIVKEPLPRTTEGVRQRVLREWTARREMLMAYVHLEQAGGRK